MNQISYTELEKICKQTPCILITNIHDHGMTIGEKFEYEDGVEQIITKEDDILVIGKKIDMHGMVDIIEKMYKDEKIKYTIDNGRCYFYEKFKIVKGKGDGQLNKIILCWGS